MQISSTNNAGFVASTGPPVALPTARRPPVELSGNAHADVSSAANARASQQIAPPVAPVNTSVNAANNADAAGALVLARQREGFDGLQGNVQTGRLGNEAVAQRAVMEYSNVAAQEQRFELISVLAGIDVFA
ncbi:hypothetical protein MNBD_GAMMA17-155 [hydrothermal vent metagenome]|uniref:Uncharacterized protein n=1 Tax=hydrothermal vent metagenome TaxID=652676 RepID=A0A3B0ZR05_9ZZZZ